MGQYSMSSEVYAFGACMHYLIWGQPLFDKDNQQDYLGNKIKSKNARFDGHLLQGIINWCLSDEVDRPTFSILEMEIFWHYLKALLEAKNDNKAVDLIKNYATMPILSH